VAASADHRLLGAAPSIHEHTGRLFPRSTLIWLGPALLSLFVSLSCINRVALWRDEMATREFSLLPIGELFRATSHVDRALTPYYLFVHFWGFLGSGSFALRLPSVIAAAVTVGVCAHIAQRTWGPLAGVVAGLALTLNLKFIEVSIEARPYALVLMLSAVATLLIVKATEGRLSQRTWWTYTVLVCAAVAAQVFTVLILLSHAVPFLRSTRRASGLRWLLAATPPVLLAGLIVWASKAQLGQLSWITKPSMVDAARTFVGMTGDPAHAVLLLLAVALVAIVQWRNKTLDEVWVMALAMLVLPPTVLFVASRVATPVLVDHYAITVLIAEALLLSAAVRTLTLVFAKDQSRRLVVVAVGAVCLIAAVSVTGLLKVASQTIHGDDYPGLALFLREQAKPGDELIIRQAYDDGGFAYGVAYYLRDSQFLDILASELPRGESSQQFRTIRTNKPFSTVNKSGVGPSSRVWLIETAARHSDNPSHDSLVAQGCVMSGDFEDHRIPRFGDISLSSYRCP
jgi:hypothetical protein